MNKDLKRRLYALALAGVVMGGVKTTVHAESLDDVDMSYVDIDDAIADLVPGYGDTNTSDGNENTNTNNGNEDNNVKDDNKNDTVTIEKTESTTVDPSHNHKFNDAADDVTNQKAPSCTSGGSYDEIHYCTECGEAKITHYEISAPGHKYESKRTETANGYTIEYTCTNKGCNHTYKEEYTYSTTPTEPKPTEPKETKPTEPKPTEAKPTPDIPKTGDDSNIALYAGLTLAAAGGIYGAGYLHSRVFDDKYKSKFTKENNGGKYLSKRR